MEVTAALYEEDLEFTGSNREVLCAYFHGSLNQYNTSIQCEQPIRAQFVQLLLQGVTALNLYEVEVHGI